MNEMVEGVAKAIHYLRPNKMLQWSDCIEDYKNDTRKQARSAIEAMREPTEAMVEAAFGKHENPNPFRTAWYAMIDAALHDK